jgi:hypothetical protein
MFVNQRKIKRNEVVINNFTESTSVSDKVLDTFIFLDTFVCTCLWSYSDYLDCRNKDIHYYASEWLGSYWAVIIW